MSNEPPPTFDKQMIDYLLARYRREVTQHALASPDSMPSWVPSLIRVERPIRGAFPDSPQSIVCPGDWPCTTTVFGIIKVFAHDRKSITISLLDCEILAFRANEKRATVLREQAEKIQSQTKKGSPCE